MLLPVLALAALCFALAEVVPPAFTLVDVLAGLTLGLTIHFTPILRQFGIYLLGLIGNPQPERSPALGFVLVLAIASVVIVALASLLMRFHEFWTKHMQSLISILV